MTCARALLAATAAAVVLPLVLAGCSVGERAPRAEPGERPAAAGPVLPAEPVFAAEPVVTPDASGTSATLSVTTELEMACAVVFGTDEALGGGIATDTDTDMGGGAHTDHEAVMRGLQPDTTYFYRVQGSGADGALYRSELATFRTPSAPAAPQVPGDDVAAGAELVEVSSEFSSAFAASNAVDGDPATEWSTRGDGDDASLTLDLGSEVEVSGVRWLTRSMGDGSAVVETFTVTVDDEQVLGPFPTGPDGTVHEVDARGRQLRFDAETTTGGNTGAVEIEVYGETGAG